MCRYLPFLFLMVMLPVSYQLHASRLIIEITEGAEGATPIAVIPFGWQGNGVVAPVDIGQIIEDNLRRSGRFDTLARGNMLSRPTSSMAVNFKNWRLLNTDYLVVGKIRETIRDQYMVQVQLINVLSEKQLNGFVYQQVHRTALRGLAHQISDVVYEELTGEKGAFNTRIAYVTSSGKKNPVYHLYVADADGHNEKPVLKSREPIMSPAWSPDGQNLAYVSFENRRSQLYIQEILTGKRQRISHFPGINGAPAWAPDGHRMAMTLSHKGNPDIYIYNLRTKRFTQLTTNSAIDTEPSWAPDGSHILFTSDRGGKPQLYKIPVLGGAPVRITYEGDYNARGVYSPNGATIAMVHGRNKRYRIALLDVATGQLTIITDGSLDESPSFSPNGRILLYATVYGNTGVLSSISVDGKYQQRLESGAGDVREPAWSSFNRLDHIINLEY